MAKRQVDISVERLGMTAKGLPQQDNYCDCGIFVLGYIEEFLKEPDSFVHDILLGKMTTERGWAKMNAPEMRKSIRELLFKLHDEQNRRETELRATKSKAKKSSRTEKTDSLDLSTNSRKHVAHKASSIPPNPILSSSVSGGPNLAEADDKAMAQYDSKDVGHEKVQSFKGINTAPPREVIEVSPVRKKSPAEQTTAKRSRGDVEESKTLHELAQDQVARTRQAGLGSKLAKISSIPSSREMTPLRSSPELQHSSPRLNTPFNPSKGRLILLESPMLEIPTASMRDSNPFKFYTKNQPSSAGYTPLHGTQQTNISEDDSVEIVNSLDGTSELPPRNIQRVDTLDKVIDAPKIPSKRIRTEGFFEDVTAGALSPTSVNSAGGASSLYPSPMTPTRASPRATRKSPRNHPAQKFIGQDLAGQYLSRQERQAQGTWSQKRRAPS
jgi:hypothetical protein